MRLTAKERQTFVDAAKQFFESTARVYLFGSRVNDDARGGDIDLLIETHVSDPNLLAKARISFLAKAYAKLGEQKIDILLDYPGCPSDSAIYHEARKNRVLL